jgi:GPH family glycoside/pentoside/hexuronide:cation symporter
VYLSPTERARLEQEKLDQIAEEKRVQELKTKCAKKGLSFEAEEEKYQKRQAKKQEKKAARRNRHE